MELLFPNNLLVELEHLGDRYIFIPAGLIAGGAVQVIGRAVVVGAGLTLIPETYGASIPLIPVGASVAGAGAAMAAEGVYYEFKGKFWVPSKAVGAPSPVPAHPSAGAGGSW